MTHTPDKTGTEQDNVSLKTEKEYKRGKHPNSQVNLKPFEKGLSIIPMPPNPTLAQHVYCVNQAVRNT